MTRRPLVTNATDARQIAHAERMQKRRREELISCLASMLKTAEGRRVCLELLSLCGYHESSFDHSGSVMNFKEGRRSVGIDLRDLLLEAGERDLEQAEREFRAMVKRVERGAEAVQSQEKTDE